MKFQTDAAARRHGAAALLAVLLGGLWSAQAEAACYRVSRAAPSTNPNDVDYVEPGKGEVRSWLGSTDTAGQGAMAMTININNEVFQPDGTLLGSKILSIYDLGSDNIGSYTPEQVLFRCSPEERPSTFYEYYSTNGDNLWAGKDEEGSAIGLPQAYRTVQRGLMARVTNLNTGEFASRYWKRRPLKLDMARDRDSRGWYLIKARHFSNYKVEFFKYSQSKGSGDIGWQDSVAGQNWVYTQPIAYSAFQGGGLSPLLGEGVDHATQWSGFYNAWPGSINPYNTVKIRRTASCRVVTVTPVVAFPPISAVEMEKGGQRTLPIEINLQCQTGSPANIGLSGFQSGTGAGQTAMGVLVQAANYQAALKEGLGTGGGGVTHLLSDGYGVNPAVATGVGVALSRLGGQRLNLLSNELITGGGALAGWYPVLQDAEATGNQSGLTHYRARMRATLIRLPGKKVKPGSLNATAQVVVRVQ
ncbi:fimbrial protein [Chromobacterium rhizoryzae]|uniref:fimbrial protein n=1 Tax=Chromobacterium rhizoryzae TaxID=1778675 RepID=UPI001D05FCA2|nr:fimbrial protein [Chromobacterium rhizoryzae]